MNRWRRAGEGLREGLAANVTSASIGNSGRSTLAQFRHRGQQRFSSLLTAGQSRVGHVYGLRDVLGAHWGDFVAYAKRHFYADWKGFFQKDMKCAGKINGRCCPRSVCLSPENLDDLEFMSGLHLDHNYEVHRICQIWKNIIAKKDHLKSWDDGVNGMLVCHLLFGVRDHDNFNKTKNPLWKANVYFRCGKKSRRHHRVVHDAVDSVTYCHENTTHSKHVLKQTDIEDSEDSE